LRPAVNCRVEQRVPASEDKQNGCSVESGPGYLGSMSVCGATQWGKLSESWPKYRFFDLHKILKYLLEGQESVRMVAKIIRFVTFGVDLFSVQGNRQSVVSSSGVERWATLYETVGVILLLLRCSLIYEVNWLWCRGK
jgi:hypothetical protein